MQESYGIARARGPGAPPGPPELASLDGAVAALLVDLSGGACVPAVQSAVAACTDLDGVACLGRVRSCGWVADAQRAEPLPPRVVFRYRHHDIALEGVQCSGVRRERLNVLRIGQVDPRHGLRAITMYRYARRPVAAADL